MAIDTTGFEDYLQGKGQNFIDELYNIGTQPFDLFNTPDFQMYYQGAYGTQLLDLVEQLENILGYVPNISDPATLQTLVDMGAIDAQTAATLGELNAPLNTKVGSLQAQFAGRGGMRALEGPYLAQQGEVFKGFQKAAQQASLGAIGTAGQFGFTKRGQDIQALLGGGGLAAQNRQINLGHPEFRPGGPEFPEFSPDQLRPLLPPEPYRPPEPSWWDRNAGALIAPALGIGGELLRDYFRLDPNAPPAGSSQMASSQMMPGMSWGNWNDTPGWDAYRMGEQQDYSNMLQQPSYNYSYDVPTEQSYPSYDWSYDVPSEQSQGYYEYPQYDYSDYYDYYYDPSYYEYPDYQYDYTSEYY